MNNVQMKLIEAVPDRCVFLFGIPGQIVEGWSVRVVVRRIVDIGPASCGYCGGTGSLVVFTNPVRYEACRVCGGRGKVEFAGTWSQNEITFLGLEDMGIDTAALVAECLRRAADFDGAAFARSLDEKGLLVARETPNGK